VGEAIGVHPSLSLPQDGKLAGASKFLQWANTHVKGHLDAAVGGIFLSLTINEATALIEKMVQIRAGARIEPQLKHKRHVYHEGGGYACRKNILAPQEV
jgi:hypothetical protein